MSLLAGAALCWTVALLPEWQVQSGPTAEDAELQAEVERLASNPIDINQATAEDLLAVPWLSLVLARRIVVLRDSLGLLGGPAQLRRVPGLDEAQVAALAPLLRFRGAPEPWQARLLAAAAGDPPATRAASWRLRERLTANRGPWSTVVQLEKDEGEASPADFVGIGLEYRRSALRAVGGDYRFGIGQGLVFGLGAGAQRPDALPVQLALEQGAAETYRLRGGAVTATLGCWQASGLASCVRRDAELRPDGTVKRLFSSGRHDDSASIAGRHALGEQTEGVALGYRLGSVRIAATGQWLNYDRSFAPSESIESFAGRNLAAAGLACDISTGSYWLGAEAARASAGGSALAFALAGEWPMLAVGCRVAARQRGFFAPHGRWRGLTGRSDRVDGSARIRYHLAGFHMTIGANTYREYSDDSLPARLSFEVGQRLQPVELRLGLGRSYRGEQGRYRTARLDADVTLGRSVLGLVLGDEHRETRPDNGQLVGLGAETRIGRFRFGATAGRFWVSGSGVTLSLPELWATQTHRSFSTSSSGWRTSAAAVWRPAELVRVGVGAGCRWPEPLLTDVAAQVELGWSGD